MLDYDFFKCESHRRREWTRIKMTGSHLSHLDIFRCFVKWIFNNAYFVLYNYSKIQLLNSKTLLYVVRCFNYLKSCECTSNYQIIQISSDHVHVFKAIMPSAFSDLSRRKKRLIYKDLNGLLNIFFNLLCWCSFNSKIMENLVCSIILELLITPKSVITVHFCLSILN